jgi:dolichol-phosphate mannosyltransferase
MISEEGVIPVVHESSSILPLRRRDPVVPKRRETAQKRVLVIIPTYNERENINRLIPQVLEQTAELEILVVDDNSPDGTAASVEETAKETGRVHLIKRPRKLGLGTAYIAGFRFALERGYDLVFEMDADFSHDPREVSNFIEAAKEADLVIGSRYIAQGNTQDWPLRRRLLSQLGNLYAHIVTGMSVKDATSGYRCFRRELLEQLDFDRIASDGYAFQIEVAFRVWKLGLYICEIPIVFADRVAGQSKLDRHIIWEAFWGLWRLRLLSLRGRLAELKIIGWIFRSR